MQHASLCDFKFITISYFSYLLLYDNILLDNILSVVFCFFFDDSLLVTVTVETFQGNFLCISIAALGLSLTVMYDRRIL